MLFSSEVTFSDGLLVFVWKAQNSLALKTEIDFLFVFLSVFI